MADEKGIDKIRRIITHQDQIRNICTSAHIHHGKTAFTDNLLAAAGMMSAAAAGDLDKGMATWQHADEQERLMTVDAANVSMVHKFDGKEYLINLIDTPGHIDFSGNVTRAMRAIDGTIVLVCASEGIMPQTETVLKQAIKERVKPILFINKVDRLISEMRYTPEQIQKKFVEIIIEFNKLIEEFAEPQFKEIWKVNIQEGSVAFGSARDNWAMSLQYMQKKKISMKDIMDNYSRDKDERDKWFWNNAPVHEVILDMVIKHLPTPKQAQTYRIGKIWHGDLESETGKNLINCNPDGKMAFVVTRVIVDSKSGREICAGRLFSGKIKEGQEVFISGRANKSRIQQVLMYEGTKTQMMQEVPAGNVLALMGIDGAAGDTISEEEMTPFEELKHIFEPVISKSIKAANPSDLPKLIEVLRKVVKEDPTLKVDINEETGENIISGMGELHLEIIENRIKTEKNVEVKTSPPIVVFRETVLRKSPEIEGKSANKHNKFYLYVEPLPDNVAAAIKSGDIPEGRVKKNIQEIAEKFIELGYDSKVAKKIKTIYKGNVLFDDTKGLIHLNEVIEMIMDGFDEVIDKGPLAREPCFKVKVVLTDCKLHEDAIHRGPGQVIRPVRDAIKEAMLAANPTLFEPIQVLDIESPVDYMGEISKLVQNRRGQLLDMTQGDRDIKIKVKLPVAESIGLASDLRSATEGKGIFFLVDQMFEPVPMSLQDKYVKQVRDRKGLGDNE